MKLSRTQLKYIAALAMVIDHVGMFFIPITTPLGALCRIVGRLTAPIMCFFLAEGFRHTSSRKKYALRLLIFAVISQFAYSLSHYHTLFTANMSMIFTLFISFLVLTVYEEEKSTSLKWLLIFALIAVSYIGDWGVFAPLWVLFFYVFRENRKKQMLAFCAVALTALISGTVFCILNGYNWYGEIWQAGLFLAVPFLLSYNGEKGRSTAFDKWFFYILYPLHLLIFGAVALFI